MGYRQETEIMVSVIVPIYNAAAYLRECIESILKQSYTNYEVILINDGSTDESGVIAQQYSQLYEKVFYFQIPNSGPGGARNKGLSHARGRYILFIDSDDMIKEETLCELVQKAESESLECLVFGADEINYIEDVTGKYKGQRGSRIEAECENGLELYSILREKRSYEVMVQCLFTRREFLENRKIIFEQGVIHEDHPFVFELYMRMGRCAAINRQYILYRRRSNSITTQKANNGRRFQGFVVALDKMISIYKDNKQRMSEDLDQKVRRHLTEMWNTAFRFYILMTRQEIHRYRESIQDFCRISCEKAYDQRRPSLFPFIRKPVRCLHFLAHIKSSYSWRKRWGKK